MQNNNKNDDDDKILAYIALGIFLLIIFVALSLKSAQAQDAVAAMKAKVHIIQCYSGERLYERCAEEPKCCAFIEPGEEFTDSLAPYSEHNEIIITPEVHYFLRGKVYE